MQDDAFLAFLFVAFVACWPLCEQNAVLDGQAFGLIYWFLLSYDLTTVPDQVKIHFFHTWVADNKEITLKLMPQNCL